MEFQAVSQDSIAIKEMWVEGKMLKGKVVHLEGKDFHGLLNLIK
jgi:hypothetical protein